MDLRSQLTGMLPLLSATLESGAYSHKIKEQALEWATTVGRAGMAEGRDTADATIALLALSKASDFEMQQLGLTASLGMCDALLEDLSSNPFPDFAPVEPERGVPGILTSMETATRQVCNLYTIPTATRMAMLKDGELLERAVRQAVSEGVRDEADLAVAREIHERVAEVATCNIARRESEAELAIAAISRLAA